MKDDNALYLPLINSSKEKRLRQSAAMHAMAALFILLYGLQYIRHIEEDWIYLVALLPFSLYTLFIAFFKRRFFSDIHFNRSFRILETGFIIMGGLHFLQEKNVFGGTLYLVFAALILILFYIEMRTLQAQFAIFQDSEIIVETPLRNIRVAYTDLKQVVLNNNYLTLVYKNDRFGQYEIVRDEHVEILQFISTRFATP